MAPEPGKKSAQVVTEPKSWANLSPDLLRLVFRKLSPNPRYFFRFQAVCQSWRTFVRSLNEDPSKFPWLIQRGSLDASVRSSLTINSVTTCETITIQMPDEYHGMGYRGSGHGNLLLTSDDNELILNNPLTGARFLLPKLSYSVWIHSMLPGSQNLLDGNIGLLSCQKEETVMGGWTPLIYNQRTKTWTAITVEAEICAQSCSSCCCNGRLYATEEASATGVYDALTGEKLHAVPPPVGEVPFDYSVYLIESQETIFRVSRSFDSDDGCEEPENSKFKIYRLAEEYDWKQVSDLREQILFLEYEMHGFSVMAPPGVEGNCIFFILDDGKPYRYDIGTSTVQKVPCPFECSSWLVPNL